MLVQYLTESDTEALVLQLLQANVTVDSLDFDHMMSVIGSLACKVAYNDTTTAVEFRQNLDPDSTNILWGYADMIFQQKPELYPHFDIAEEGALLREHLALILSWAKALDV